MGKFDYISSFVFSSIKISKLHSAVLVFPIANTLIVMFIFIALANSET